MPSVRDIVQEYLEEHGCGGCVIWQTGALVRLKTWLPVVR
jgi:hypothetical protein